jgi:hypothetical protein
VILNGRTVQTEGGGALIDRDSGNQATCAELLGGGGGVTTAYIANYFEWSSSSSTMKRYYYAGSTREAMRTGSNTINYLLGDHSLACALGRLGSTAITTDSSGANPAEIRSYPWGKERYTSGTTPTNFRFTGRP